MSEAAAQIREYVCENCGNELLTTSIELPAERTKGYCVQCGSVFELPFYVVPDWILAPNGGAAHRGLIAERSDDPN